MFKIILVPWKILKVIFKAIKNLNTIKNELSNKAESFADKCLEDIKHRQFKFLIEHTLNESVFTFDEKVHLVQFLPTPNELINRIYRHKYYGSTDLIKKLKLISLNETNCLSNHALINFILTEQLNCSLFTPEEKIYFINNIPEMSVISDRIHKENKKFFDSIKIR